MHQRPLAAGPEPEIVKGSIAIVLIHLEYTLLKYAGAVKLHSTELEIISQSSLLAIDDRGTDDSSPLKKETVRIDHCGTGIACNLNHTVKGVIDPFQLSAAGIDYCVVAPDAGSKRAQFPGGDPF